MNTCGEMKAGQVYTCPTCGFEVEIKKECNCHTGSDCQPSNQKPCCELNCCGKEMVQK